MKNEMPSVLDSRFTRIAAVIGFGVAAMIPAAHAQSIEMGAVPKTGVVITSVVNEVCNGKYDLEWTGGGSPWHIYYKLSTATSYALYGTSTAPYATVSAGADAKLKYDFKVENSNVVVLAGVNKCP